ncbi:MAG: hypothetical protein ABI355_07860, partial [Solirubrobacteraceae bacterium]
GPRMPADRLTTRPSATPRLLIGPFLAATGTHPQRLALDIGAFFMRLRHTRVPSSWEHRHARLMLPVRVLIGTWLLFLTAILYGYGRGGWWGLLLLPAAALHFYIAYRLRHALRSSSR